MGYFLTQITVRGACWGAQVISSAELLNIYFKLREQGVFEFTDMVTDKTHMLMTDDTD